MAKAPVPCSHCGTSGATFICSRCRHTSYCSAACQRDAWSVHKRACHTPFLLSDTRQECEDAASSPDPSTLLAMDTHAICALLESAASTDSLGKFNPVCKALVRQTKGAPAAYWLHALRAFRLFLGGSVRSAPIASGAYAALNGVLIAILGLKLPFVGEPSVHVGMLRHFIRDGVVAHGAISCLMLELGHASDAVRAAFPTSGALELLAEAAQRHIHQAEPQPDVAHFAFLMVTQSRVPLDVLNKELARVGFLQIALQALALRGKSSLGLTCRASAVVHNILKWQPDQLGVASEAKIVPIIIATFPDALRQPVSKPSLWGESARHLTRLLCLLLDSPGDVGLEAQEDVAAAVARMLAAIVEVPRTSDLIPVVAEMIECIGKLCKLSLASCGLCTFAQPLLRCGILPALGRAVVKYGMGALMAQTLSRFVGADS